jgi:hypothetical protein
MVTNKTCFTLFIIRDNTNKNVYTSYGEVFCISIMLEMDGK